MNRLITPAEMQDWIKHTWQKCQDEAWEEKGMTKEYFIRMALQAGAKPSSNPEKWDVLEISDKSLERFVEFIAAHEREECAELCDYMEAKAEGTECCKWPTPQDCAEAIRARREK